MRDALVDADAADGVARIVAEALDVETEHPADGLAAPVELDELALVGGDHRLDTSRRSAHERVGSTGAHRLHGLHGRRCGLGDGRYGRVAVHSVVIDLEFRGSPTLERGDAGGFAGEVGRIGRKKSGTQQGPARVSHSEGGGRWSTPCGGARHVTQRATEFKLRRLTVWQTPVELARESVPIDRRGRQESRRIVRDVPRLWTAFAMLDWGSAWRRRGSWPAAREPPVRAAARGGGHGFLSKSTSSAAQRRRSPQRCGLAAPPALVARARLGGGPLGRSASSWRASRTSRAPDAPRGGRRRRTRGSADDRARRHPRPHVRRRSDPCRRGAGALGPRTHPSSARCSRSDTLGHRSQAAPPSRSWSRGPGGWPARPCSRPSGPSRDARASRHGAARAAGHGRPRCDRRATPSRAR